MNDWHYKTDTPESGMKCLFYDDQNGNAFVDFGDTDKLYTYWIYI